MREYGAAFRATHHVSHEQERVLQAIAQCRTAALGGHVEVCESCGTEQISYNSCHTRHCPKCQGAARAKWLAAEEALLLPVPYFHVVFTLPHLLNPLVRVNPRRLYTLVFQTVARTLRQLARDPNHLGAELGITAVLHTWGQTLTEHSHLHCLVTGGGLSVDGRQWRPSHPRFLFAVEALSQVFRGKSLAGLRRLRAQHQLHFVGESAEWAAEEAWQAFLHQVQDRPWVVYARPPFGGPEQVLKDLSRYVYRVAISNARLVFVGDGVVRFLSKDYAAGGSTQTK
ncbi:MAG: transposase, partial [Acidobacteria bacterium]|nr:transposase [Acidobacteriota bacterium]